MFKGEKHGKSGEPYTKGSYRFLILIHFVFCIPLSACFVLGLHYSGSERGTNKTPYFFTAMVLIGFNVLGILFSLFVIINTRNDTVFIKNDAEINKALLWYNLLLNFGIIWGFVGGIISFTMGCCKGHKCYAQTNVGTNIAIGAVIGVLHILCFIWYVLIAGNVRGLHPPTGFQSKIKPIKRITIETDSDTSDSDLNNKKKQLKLKLKQKVDGHVITSPEKKPDNTPANVKYMYKAVDTPSKFPFAVLSKSIVLFMANKKKAKEVAPKEPKVETIFKQDGSRGYPLIKTSSKDKHPPRANTRPTSAPGLDFAVPLPLQPPPAYDSVITNDDNRRNPYHLQPLPYVGDHRFPPENLYSEASYPDTVLTVAQPLKAKPLVRSRLSDLK